ncbi:riboflavin synthase [Heliophilum fasciatum]|uniref:Riboflavin synthase n=1 Tax=Heliophilum fasciatum TaxID=35700 RepID=A0A4V6NRS6_9FIRM|nr:riboflavin synthase [Heliophilum fasciatum]MCW2277199.1 riboflavin synthase [Heliophilum fasciatum]TCP68166.1 riboflavin synthase alpha chain [Heliophilum fasciatum]
MFTGIVEALGTVRQIKRGAQSARIRIDAAAIMNDVHLGDSIAVNGICLTVVAFDGRGFEADVMAETLRRTSLAQVKPGTAVNVERAMRADGRFGGHLVSGHIDGVGTIRKQTQVDIAVLTEIACEAELLKYMIPQGSVAIDGISLTIVDVRSDGFQISLIPHTGQMTTLGFKKAGDLVNLEVDVLAKYIERLLATGRGNKVTPAATSETKAASTLTRAFLMENGY